MREADDLVSANAEYSAPISENLTHTVITAALDKLPEHYLTVVPLADAQDFDYKAVAENLKFGGQPASVPDLVKLIFGKSYVRNFLCLQTTPEISSDTARQPR